MSLIEYDGIGDEYFEWIYNLICNDHYNKKLSYKKLLHALNNIEFYYKISMDENRAEDGIDFRYRFGYENGYSQEMIKKKLDIRPCSVLEMMVSLAFDIEEQIMDDQKCGNRTGQWFWNMIVNLDLGSMYDDNFDINYVNKCVHRFLNREYKKNGEGGLFTVKNYDCDMRNAEIWYQAMWYLDEFIGY